MKQQPIPGTLVRMTAAFKAQGLATGPEGNALHIHEFGACVGVLLGPMYPDWPEWDVCWEPSGLRYGYALDNLEVAE